MTRRGLRTIRGSCGPPLALVALAAALASCGSASGAHATSTRDSANSCSQVKVVSDRANRGTVRLCVGQRLVLRLHSTYWSAPTSLPTAVLRRVGRTIVRPAPPTKCVPGAGCGTSTTHFLAVARGRAIVAAHRELCGEAVQCRKRQRSFVLVVVVRRSGG